jgi:hypothetical protein
LVSPSGGGGGTSVHREPNTRKLLFRVENIPFGMVDTGTWVYCFGVFFFFYQKTTGTGGVGDIVYPTPVGRIESSCETRITCASLHRRCCCGDEQKHCRSRYGTRMCTTIIHYRNLQTRSQILTSSRRTPPSIIGLPREVGSNAPHSNKSPREHVVCRR